MFLKMDKTVMSRVLIFLLTSHVYGIKLVFLQDGYSPNTVSYMVASSDCQENT